LELAARAADYEIFWEEDVCNLVTYYGATKTWEPWNPLENNGDALELAVRLHLCIEHGNYETRVFEQWEDTALALVKYGDDPSLATRRAIVVAAGALAIARAIAEQENHA
jgi:hypothetical protein